MRKAKCASNVSLMIPSIQRSDARVSVYSRTTPISEHRDCNDGSDEENCHDKFDYFCQDYRKYFTGRYPSFPLVSGILIYNTRPFHFNGIYLVFCQTGTTRRKQQVFNYPGVSSKFKAFSNEIYIRQQRSRATCLGD